MARLRDSGPTSLPASQQPRNPQSESIARTPYHTPRSDALSAGIVSFDLEGLSPAAVVRRLRKRRIVGSVAPYAVPHVRLTPCVYNAPTEIETVLREVRTLIS